MLKYFISACFCIMLISSANAQSDTPAQIHFNPPYALTLYGGPVSVPPAFFDVPGGEIGAEIEFPYAKYAGFMVNANTTILVHTRSFGRTDLYFLPGVSIGPRWYMKERSRALFIETGPEAFAFLRNTSNKAGGGLGINLGVGHTFTFPQGAQVMVKVKGRAGVIGSPEGHPGIGGYLLTDLNLGWMIKL